jgi:transcriptional regulator with XRE-family HTH domain
MAVKRMNLDQFLEFMKKQQGEQTAQQFATRLGVSPQYLSDVYNGRRPPGESITAALKVEKAVVYTMATPSKPSLSRNKAEEEK